MNPNQIADIIGIFGVCLVLLGYGLLNTGKVTALSMNYQLLNLFGSALILYSLFFNWNLPAAIIEVAWIVVSFIGIYRSRRYSRS